MDAEQIRNIDIRAKNLFRFESSVWHQMSATHKRTNASHHIRSILIFLLISPLRVQLLLHLMFLLSIWVAPQISTAWLVGTRRHVREYATDLVFHNNLCLKLPFVFVRPIHSQQKQKTKKRINKLTQTKKRSRDGKWQRQASFTSITFTQATQPKRWENILIWDSFLNEIRLMFNYEFSNAFQTTIEQHHQQQLNEQCNANKDTLMTHPRVDGCWQMFHLGILQVLSWLFIVRVRWTWPTYFCRTSIVTRDSDDFHCSESSKSERATKIIIISIRFVLANEWP